MQNQDKKELTPDQERYIRGFAWPTLLSSSVWALGNKLWWWFLGSLVPIWNIYVLIKLFLHGRKMSWDKGNWESFDKFRRRQTQIVMIILAIAAFYIIFVVFSSLLQS